MKALGMLVAFAFVAFVVLVGVAVISSMVPTHGAELSEVDSQVLTAQQLANSSTTAGKSGATVEAVHSEILSNRSIHGEDCHTIGDGYLESNAVFGSYQASHIHVSYWTPAGPDQRERDVVLSGGRWQRDEGVGGYFWVFAGCTEAQVRQQVELHQVRKREELGDRHAGWGDASYFTRID